MMNELDCVKALVCFEAKFNLDFLPLTLATNSMVKIDYNIRYQHLNKETKEGSFNFSINSYQSK